MNKSSCLIFAESTNATVCSIAKMLSVVSNPERIDYLIAVSNRKKTSGLEFSTADGLVFSRLLAMALHLFEEGIPATINSI